MRHRLIFIVSLLMVLLVKTIAWGESPGAADAGGPSGKKSFIVTDISSEPTKKIQRLLPFADYVAGRLVDQYSRGEVRIGKDSETIAKWLMDGQADIYMDSVYPAMLVAGQSNARAACARWKDGVKEYHSVFLAKKQSGLTQIGDLVGRVIAFEEPFSTSGYLLPAGYLLLNRMQLSQIDSPNDEVPAGKVGWLFAQEDQNVVQWLLTGKVDAGVIDNVNYAALPQKVKNSMNVLALTPSVPRQIVLIRGSIAPEVREKIISILVNMDKDEEGRKILAEMKSTKCFRRLDSSELAETFEYMSRLFEVVSRLQE